MGQYTDYQKDAPCVSDCDEFQFQAELIDNSDFLMSNVATVVYTLSVYIII